MDTTDSLPMELNPHLPKNQRYSADDPCVDHAAMLSYFLSDGTSLPRTPEKKREKQKKRHPKVNFVAKLITTLLAYLIAACIVVPAALFIDMPRNFYTYLPKSVPEAKIWYRHAFLAYSRMAVEAVMDHKFPVLGLLILAWVFKGSDD